MVAMLIDDLTKGSITEGRQNTARVSRTHRIVRPVLRITFHGTLHGNTTVENDVDERAELWRTSAIEARAEYSPRE